MDDNDDQIVNKAHVNHFELQFNLQQKFPNERAPVHPGNSNSAISSDVFSSEFNRVQQNRTPPALHRAGMEHD